MTMGNRIVVINQGVVQQEGAPLALYREPVNLFVAGFLGSPAMNFVSGRLKKDGDKIRFCETEGGTIEVAFPADEGTAAHGFAGKDVVLGIRPEDLKVANVSRREGKAAGTGFRAIIDSVEPMGAETNLYLQTGAHTLICRTQNAFDHREAGHRLQFEIDPGKAHLFDPVSTRRLGQELGP